MSYRNACLCLVALVCSTQGLNAQSPVPELSYISPGVLRAGSPAFLLEIDGSGFVPSSQVRWNDSPRITIFHDSFHLTAEIEAGDVAKPGAASVRVFNPAPGGGLSGALTFTITEGNPAPQLRAIFPSIMRAGSSGFVLEVSGEGFAPESSVRWNGSARRTTYVSASTLGAEILAADIATAGTATVTVLSPAPGGGTSDGMDFTVTEGNPVPKASSISPSTLRAGSATFMLEVNGEGFVPESEVRWNNASRKTTYVGFAYLLAEITAADIANAGTAGVSVFSPAPGGGTSEAIEFAIVAGNPTPRISSIHPDIVRAGSPGFVLEVNGEGFVSASQVYWNGAPRTTTYTDVYTALQAVITASDVAAPGTAYVTVVNPPPDGGASEPASFTISEGNPVPRLSAFSPSAIKAGSPTFQLNVSGFGFVSGSTVLWNSSARKTTYQGASELTAEISALDILAPGRASVTVSSPAPGGGTSNALYFSTEENSLVPEVCDVSPDAAAAGSEALEVTVTGSNFVSNSIVQWNGSGRPTTFLNNTQIRAQIPVSDLAAAGQARVTVLNPPPGGGTSNVMGFTVSPSVNPVPAIEKTSPVSAHAGGPGFLLSVQGSDFTGRSVVRWNGSDRSTSFESAVLLTALVSATDIAAVGTASVTVFTPAPGGGESQAAGFQICDGICLAVVSPNIAPVGGGDLKLTIFGNDFDVPPKQGTAGNLQAALRPNTGRASTPTVVLWNGQPLITTVVSRYEMTAAVPAGLIASAGTAQIYATGSGGSSNAIPVPISLNNPAPLLSALDPPGVQAGGSEFRLLVSGTNFVSNSRVLWNGEEKRTSYVDSTQLRADISATDIAAPGVAVVNVRNPQPRGGDSNEQAFVFANSLYYPRLVSKAPSDAGPGEYTGIALVNLSSREATITFTAYDRGGALLTGADVTNPIALSLGPRQQMPVVDYQVFGAGLPALNPAGWFRVGSSENRILGFFLAFDDQLSILDGVDVSAETLRTAVMSEIDALGETWIHTVNADTKSAAVLFELYRSDGVPRTAPVTRTVGPNAAVVESLAGLFPGSGPSESDYLRIVSDRDMATCSFMGRKGKYVLGLNGQDAAGGATVLYSPQYVVGGGQWRSALSVVNLESVSGKVSLRFVADDGSQIGPVRVETISARGKLHITDQKYFVDPGTRLTQGYLEIRSDGPRLAGNVVFGDPNRESFASALPLVSRLQDAVVFSQLASNATYFTGLAMLNPNKESARAAIEVYDEEGNIIASKVEEIGPGLRKSQLLTEYFPSLRGQSRSLGYFRVTSDRKIASFALFGTNDLSVLSAVPPQVVP